MNTLAAETIRVGAFSTANKLLGDPAALQAQLERDGYLFFRGVLDSRRVLEIQRDFVAVLAGQGAVQPHQPEPVWTGCGIESIDDDPLYALPSWQAMLDDDGV